MSDFTCSVKNAKVLEGFGELSKISNDKVTAFIYLLMRDVIAVGKVEAIVKEVEKNGGGLAFCNVNLYNCAKEMSKRLSGQQVDGA